jgi:hypothetical protein
MHDDRKEAHKAVDVGMINFDGCLDEANSIMKSSYNREMVKRKPAYKITIKINRFFFKKKVDKNQVTA